MAADGSDGQDGSDRGEQSAGPGSAGPGSAGPEPAGPAQDDAELLARIRDGSHAAFTALVERHAERFHALAYRFVQNRTAAEDIVQEAFLRLWAQPGRWRPGSGAQFATWFHRVVVNLCLDWHKRKRPVALDESAPLADERPGQDAEVIRAQQQLRLEREIAALPERQRIALNLCFDESLSNQQAADVMGLSLKALQALLMRAKTTLRQRLRGDLLRGDL